MHSSQKLAAALRSAGLETMALKAEAHYYHDYLSPLEVPCVQLPSDLYDVGTPAALNLRARALEGEFDASAEEGEDWAASADGKAAFDWLMRP